MWEFDKFIEFKIWYVEWRFGDMKIVSLKILVKKVDVFFFI